MDSFYEWRRLTFKQWIKRSLTLGRWFLRGWSGWLVFLSLLVVGLGPVYLFWTDPISRDHIVIYGVVIQIAGFCLTIIGVNSNLKHFGLLSIPSRLYGYFIAMPLLPFDRVRVVSVHAHAKVSATLVGQIGNANSRQLSTSERIVRLESDILDIRKTLNDISGQQASGFARIDQKIDDLGKASITEVEKLRSDVSDLFDSSVALEVCGIGLFIVGVFYSTLPWVLDYFL
ncbi:hypothetical protein ROE7235_01834 [Roseibaca ekhonensis]|uniref:Uncharacterized protein n=1 Tax=Roseinatronobacter ekhonensis TaxID=254356 RepID=A0A3B0M842_9RHOB|nr:hypothetical protein [Roseibaca ekhonensis]SUZ32082.1 hypothetical protein ROE7235_01834 [Roseibaca ekhonensis]